MKRGRVPAITASFALVGGVVATMPGCGILNSTPHMPNYSDPGLYDAYAETFEAGARYAQRTNMLPPLPPGLVQILGDMAYDKADIDTNWLDAIGMRWADNALAVDDMSRMENYSHALAALNGAMSVLETSNPAEYERGEQMLERFYDDYEGRFGHGYRGPSYWHKHGWFDGKASDGHWHDRPIGHGRFRGDHNHGPNAPFLER